MYVPATISTIIYAFLCFTPATALPAPAEAAHKESPVRLLFEYPKGTWLENIAVRPSGELLLTHLEKPQLDQFNPLESSARPEEVHTFEDVLSLSGIAEIAPDSFAVTLGNFSFESGAQKGSWSIWGVDFSKKQTTSVSVDEIASIPDAVFPNGMCNVPSSKYPNDILYGDIRKGAVWRIDTETGSSALDINNTLTAAIQDPIFGTSGVNGIHIQDGVLYFVNSAKRLFASLPVKTDGTPAGDPKIITRVHKPETVFYFDDFAIKDDDAFLVTGSGNSIERIGLDGMPKGQIIVGNLNSTQFAGPTSAAFGRTERDRHILYVATSGAQAAPVDGNITTGAQILAVDTSRWDC